MGEAARRVPVAVGAVRTLNPRCARCTPSGGRLRPWPPLCRNGHQQPPGGCSRTVECAPCQRGRADAPSWLAAVSRGAAGAVRAAHLSVLVRAAGVRSHRVLGRVAAAVASRARGVVLALNRLLRTARRAAQAPAQRRQKSGWCVRQGDTAFVVGARSLLATVSTRTAAMFLTGAACVAFVKARHASVVRTAAIAVQTG